MKRRTTKTLAQLKSELRADLLGEKATPTEPGEVQCPFCSTVYQATEPEHFISGICNPCWPSEPPEPPPEDDCDNEHDDEDLPF